MSRYVIWVFSAIIILGCVIVLTRWPRINVVETGRMPEYPDVQPKRYALPVPQVFDAAMHAVNQLPRWRVITYQPDRGEIRVEATTRLLRFVDDVMIRLTNENGTTVVSVRSASRVGRSDFGQNARNIRKFLRELDSQVQRGDRHP